MNYGWWAEIFNGGVRTSLDPVDGVYVFATFTEARAALAKHFEQAARDMRDSATQVRQLRKADPLAPGEWGI